MNEGPHSQQHWDGERCEVSHRTYQALLAKIQMIEERHDVLSHFSTLTTSAVSQNVTFHVVPTPRRYL